MRQYFYKDKNDIPVVMLKDDEVSYDRLVPMHSHRAFELSTVEEGHGVYVINNREYPYEKGDVFIIGNRSKHQLRPAPGTKTVNLTLHFEPEYISLPFETDENLTFFSIFDAHNEKFSNRLDRDNPSTEDIYQHVHNIVDEAERKLPTYHLKIRVILEHIIIEILRNYDYFQLDTSVLEKSKKDAHMQDVIEYINFHYNEELTLDALSRIACVSPTYFSALFKQENDIGLFEYIAKKRIAIAASLLAEDNLNITDIAFRCGYNTTGNFNKAFRRIKGCSPSDYRKHHMRSTSTLYADQEYTTNAFLPASEDGY